MISLQYTCNFLLKYISNSGNSVVIFVVSCEITQPNLFMFLKVKEFWKHLVVPAISS